MTGTSAIAQFTDRVKSAAFFFVLVLTVVPGMAARAVRLIGRIRPREILTVVRVTFGTSRVSPVISRIIPGAVRKVNLHPSIRTVTLVAL